MSRVLTTLLEINMTSLEEEGKAEEEISDEDLEISNSSDMGVTTTIPSCALTSSSNESLL